MLHLLDICADPRLEEAIASSAQSIVDPSAELILQTDASSRGMGAVLLQRQKDQPDRPLAFISRAFNPTERKWSTIEQECFGIFYAVKSLSHFLQGVPFEVQTDHRNLLYMATSYYTKGGALASGSPRF